MTESAQNVKLPVAPSAVEFSGLQTAGPRYSIAHFTSFWVLAMACGILYIKAGDAFSRPMFWAEDMMFFVEAYYEPVRSIFVPYAGYFHLPPRLIALFADSFPLLYAPAIFNGLTLLLYFGIILSVLSNANQLPNKSILALLIFLAPHSGEALLAACVTQFPLMFLIISCLFLVNKPASRTAQLAFPTGLLLAGLSTPLVVIFLPLYATRLLLPTVATRYSVFASVAPPAFSDAQARRYFTFLTTVLLLAALVQLDSIASQGGTIRFEGEVFSLVHSLKILSWRNVGPLIPGLSIETAWIAAVGLLVVFCVALYYSPAHRFQMLAILYVILAINLMTQVKHLSFYGFDNLVNADRYFFVQKALIYWLMVIPIRRVMPLMGALVLISLSIALSPYSFVRTPLIDYDWPSQAKRIEEGLARGEVVEFQVNPPPWKGSLMSKEAYAQTMLTEQQE